MKSSETINKSQKELLVELDKLKSELFKLRFQHATNQLDNPMKINFVKKDIARVKTVMRQNEINGSI